MRSKVERQLNLHNAVQKRHIIRPHRIAIEHLRVVLNGYIELMAEGDQVKGLKLMHIDDLL